MVKMWNTTETKPKEDKRIITIDKKGEVNIWYYHSHPFEKDSFCGTHKWSEVVLWQYVDKLFNEEIKKSQEE